MQPETTDESWLILVDGRQARLLRCERTPVGHCHVRIEDITEPQWEGHEHGRPSLADKVGHSYAPAHDEEEAEHRFARQVVRWLDAATRQRGIDHVTVYAPPRMLGCLRAAKVDAGSVEVDLHEGDLAQCSLAQLQEHSALRGIVGLPRGT